MRNEQGFLLPDFLIIGAGKSGTTSLDFYLNQHPAIFMPEVKEPNFFGYEAHSMTDFKDEETREHFKNSITDFVSYVSLFKGAEKSQLIGEISNTTVYMPEALKAVKKYLPDAKLIAILRQPAERLFSRYTHLLRVNKVPTEHFEEDIFDKGTIWWSRADLVQEGFYAKHLSKYYENFPAENIKILLFEDLMQDAEGTMDQITQFLGLASFEFEMGTQFNKSGKIKNRSINKLLGHDSVIIKSLKSIIPGVYKGIKENTALKKLVENLRSKNIEKVKLSVELKKKITQEIYNEDIQKLEKLIQKDLSHWK
ncbi:MAG: hypothetical protein ACI8Q1_002268 [Parvicella sp.]|jgi:hypothetical protein